MEIREVENFVKDVIGENEFIIYVYSDDKFLFATDIIDLFCYDVMDDCVYLKYNGNEINIYCPNFVETFIDDDEIISHKFVYDHSEIIFQIL